MIVNEHARRGRDGVRRATAALRAVGHDVIAAELPRESDALTDLISSYRGRVDIVAVGGGDGTLISAIAGIRALDVPLLVLPLGTINELARTLGIPPGIEAACALLEHGSPRPIDVGSVNGRLFFNEASIGLSTHVALEQTEEVKSRFGMLAIPLATLRSLRSMRPYRLEVESESGNHTFRTVQLTVANSYRFGGVVENDEARIDDGTLDLYSIDIRHAWDAFSVIVAVALKRFPKARCVEDLRGRRFVVRSRHRHRVFADGEPATHTPAEFLVHRHA
ncbi:MAG: YegS/Rv2252/BmrU family lipid kinase, partial [Candidatus Eremiobacteraeota bacterium]|nr:YegS/Rv2252/BmrU family lipid kinase [Candidatus Eremiobacteraeota bacterium]